MTPTHSNAIRFPGPIQRRLERSAQHFLTPSSGSAAASFSEPRGEPALVRPDSLSWRMFKSPLVMFIGGVTAVVLQLAEPRVRAGVWDHTSFRKNPLQRLQRTGLAAMMSVYGPRNQAEALIARPLQRLLVKAGIDILPQWVRERLQLGAQWSLKPWERWVVTRAVQMTDRLLLTSSPAVQACRRMGLPDDYLYRPPAQA